MMRTNRFFFFLLVCIFFVSDTAYSQNFDETWKEFLLNNKISNMSRLSRPDKRYEEVDYAKYLLMNTNNSFCQSKVEAAEDLMIELQEIGSDIHESIPGFERKMDDLEKKLKAYHEIDEIWNRFLKTKEATVEELEEVYPPSTICEKHTLVKYSYMTAYYYLCNGDFEEAKSTFESRTLKIAEKTSLRVKDVKGLAPQVRDMKSLFKNISELDDAWETYIDTEVSPGFDIKLPIFPCYPIPNMKEYVLRGAADICGSGSKMLKKIEKLGEESGVVPEGDLEEKIEELKEAVGENRTNLAALNKAWKAFTPENKVKHFGEYGYEYCTKEPLIRAYIMDGFSFVCDMGDEALEKIDSIRKSGKIKLRKSTLEKINQLVELNKDYQVNGVEIERIWNEFVANGDTLLADYYSTDQYCDHIQEVKDWTMRGLSVSCEEARPYLEQIEELSRTFEFKFYGELECRVQNLRFKVWNCRYQTVLELAKLEASPDSLQYRLEELMEEYQIDERPEVCLPNE